MIHRELASDLYQAVYLLRWEDGEPRWKTSKKMLVLNPSRVPTGIGDVVLVMKKLPPPKEVRAIYCTRQSSHRHFTY